MIFTVLGYFIVGLLVSKFFSSFSAERSDSLLSFKPVFLWPPLSCRHQSSSRPFYSSPSPQACIRGPPKGWRRRTGRPRQTWLRTICCRSISAWIDWHGVNSTHGGCYTSTWHVLTSEFTSTQLLTNSDSHFCFLSRCPAISHLKLEYTSWLISKYPLSYSQNCLLNSN